MENHRFNWSLFIAISVISVIAVFGITKVLEGTLFAGSSFEALKYLYMSRGASASFLVMTWALLFIVMERRRTEAVLRKLSRAVEQSPVTVMITDAAANIEYVNPHFTQLTGYTQQEIVGKNPRILQSGQTPRETYKNLWGTITSGREWHGEVLNRKKNGELYWEALSISAITDSKGNVMHYVGVLEDITERKTLDHLKDEFVGTVSHELRTPLAIIKWSIQNLEDGLAGSLKKDQAELVEGIRRNCARLERIINEVLDLSRLESGKAKINRRQINLIPLLQESLQNFKEAARRSHLVLEEDLPPQLPDLDADPDMVIQLLDNLLENAIRFAKKKVLVKARANEDAVQVSIIDDGPGIAEEQRERLFSKFEQISRSPGRKGYKGTGLGLAISKEIVGHHRGKIWVGGEVGKGAEFHFTLPTREGHFYDKTEEENSRH